jgi:hypothetical protein
MTKTKTALIRREGYPIGQPAPMYLNCCGKAIDVEKPFDKTHTVTCPHCRVSYDGAGWVKAVQGKL